MCGRVDLAALLRGRHRTGHRARDLGRAAARPLHQLPEPCRHYRLAACHRCSPPALLGPGRPHHRGHLLPDRPSLQRMRETKL